MRPCVAAETGSWGGALRPGGGCRGEAAGAGCVMEASCLHTEMIAGLTPESMKSLDGFLELRDPGLGLWSWEFREGE